MVGNDLLDIYVDRYMLIYGIKDFNKMSEAANARSKNEHPIFSARKSGGEWSGLQIEYVNVYFGANLDMRVVLPQLF